MGNDLKCSGTADHLGDHIGYTGVQGAPAACFADPEGRVVCHAQVMPGAAMAI